MDGKENTTQTQADHLSTKKQWPLIVSVIVIAVLAIIGIIAVTRNRDSISEQEISEYNEVIADYNTVAENYKKVHELASLKDASDLPTPSEPKECLDISSGKRFSKNMIAQDMAQIQEETEALNKALSLAQSIFNQKISDYNEAAQNYNAVLDEYKRIRTITSLENIDGLPEAMAYKISLEENIETSDFVEKAISQDAIVRSTGPIVQETEDLLYALILAQQITVPSEDWVIERLKSISTISGIQAVTKNHDPNQLLNVNGGYTSCVYFSVDGIDQHSIQGTSIIDKGTDAGGAIEVYKTVTDAQRRCDYLGQFNNTLLYSGSYAIVGTTVIRTSYLLTNEKQVELTNKITTAFIALK